MIDFNVDFIDHHGEYGCQAFRAPYSDDVDSALASLLVRLVMEQKQPYSISRVHGVHSTEELERIIHDGAAAAARVVFEPIWCDKQLLDAAVLDELKKHRRTPGH